MRTLGNPSASTVASDIAVGSRGSLAFASSNQAANSRRGSSACVKSPLVNQLGCSIGADSDIARSVQVVALVASIQSRQPGYKAMSSQWHAGLRRYAARAHAIAFAFALMGCSFSYQLDNLFAKREEGAAAQTGSLRLVSPNPAAEAPAEGDLDIVRAAASEVLTKVGKDVSMPCDNPRT